MQAPHPGRHHDRDHRERRRPGLPGALPRAGPAGAGGHHHDRERARHLRLRRRRRRCTPQLEHRGDRRRRAAPRRPTSYPRGEAQTTLDDIALSSAASLLHDTGAIAVGATTENDIFADPPHYSTDPADRGQPAFAATRWTGATDFASGFGSRVDLSAPGDSILSMSHLPAAAPRDAQPNLAEGTGISAAEVAASVAVVRQVADLTGQSFDGPRDVRSYLQETATAVADVPQADRHLEVGGQVNLTRAVERLLAVRRDTGRTPASPGSPSPSAVRWPTSARSSRPEPNPEAINLRGPRSPIDGTLDRRQQAGVDHHRAGLGGRPGRCDLRRSARPASGTASSRQRPIRAAAPRPDCSPRPVCRPTRPTAQTVELDYEATMEAAASTSTRASLVFGPSPRTSAQVLAPRVAPVIDGDAVTVRYDLRHARGLQVPVSPGDLLPGSAQPGHRRDVRPAADRRAALHAGRSRRAGSGVVHIPVDDLRGCRHLRHRDPPRATTRSRASSFPVYSDFAYTRVAADLDQRSRRRRSSPMSERHSRSPRARCRTAAGCGSTWDVSNVPGADGADLEVSAPGPASAVGVNTFNNPEGDRP